MRWLDVGTLGVSMPVSRSRHRGARCLDVGTRCLDLGTVGRGMRCLDVGTRCLGLGQRWSSFVRLYEWLPQNTSSRVRRKSRP